MAGADGHGLRVTVMGDTHIELSALETSAIHALIEAPGEIGGAGRVIVPGLPGNLGTTVKVAVWNSLPGLLLADRRSADV